MNYTSDFYHRYQRAFVALVSVSFICIWFNAFILRAPWLSKPGTVLLIGLISLVLTQRFKKDYKNSLVGFSLILLAFLLHDYALRDAILMFFIYWGFKTDTKLSEGFFQALKVFFVIGFIAILLSFLGIGHPPEWASGRLIGRYSLGFVTAYHLAEFAIVVFVYSLFSVKNKYLNIFSVIFLLAILVLSNSRVAIVASVVVGFIYFIKNNKINKYIILIGFLASFLLVFLLLLSHEFGYFSSGRSDITRAIMVIYHNAYLNHDYVTFILGIINDDSLANLVNNPVWKSSVPIDGIGMKVLASGILGGAFAIFFWFFLTKKVINFGFQENYILIIFIVFLGLGSDMLNTWHIITFYLFASLSAERP